MNTIITISILAIIVLFLGVMKQKVILLPIILLGLALAFYLDIYAWDTTIRYYNEMFIADNFSIAFNAVLIFGSFLVFLFAKFYYKAVQRPLEDIFALFLFALLGGLLMTSFGNLIMLFMGIETLSISLYILAGSKKADSASNEAAMKYFIIGSFASGFLVFGIALIYGASGSFNVTEIGNYVASNSLTTPKLFYAGMLLVFVGMAFKTAAVPFHFWAPDVYTGSPTLITAFMATVGKVAAIAAFYRLVSYTFADAHTSWTTTLWVLAAATIILGNLSAVYQDNMKRLLAYSGISHAGYMLLAILALGPKSAGSLLFYALAYTVATVTAFALVILIRAKNGSFSIQSFKGFAKNNPLEAFAMAIAMMSLAGIPPMAGFVAKYNIFIVAIQGGFIWLTIIAIVGSMVSVYYYFRPIIAMYFSDGEPQPKMETDLTYKLSIIFCTLLIIGLGLVSGLVVGMI